MKKLIGCLITAAILWLAASVFPNAVQIDSLTTLLLVIVAMVVLDIVIGLMSLGAFGACAASANAFTIGISVLMFFVLIFSFPVELAILSSNLDGFSIDNFGMYVLLTIIHFLLTASFKAES